MENYYDKSDWTGIVMKEIAVPYQTSSTDSLKEMDASEIGIEELLLQKDVTKITLIQFWASKFQHTF